jgi:HlyD family secretion protein
MKKSPIQGRTLAMLAVVIPLLALFIYVGLRSGPLAPVAIKLATVETRAVTPALFGIGTLETRYTYKIGPTFAGRVQRLDAQVGDRVKAGQIFGEMDPVDLDDRVRSQNAAFKRAQAALLEAEARLTYAQTQANRYEKLFTARLTSEDIVTTRREELKIAEAGFSAAREDLARTHADREGVVAQRNSLRLIAPADGVVAERYADPGTTIVAGQPVVEIIDPKSLWINVRFDQISASGLAKGLPARIVLRSRSGQTSQGRVLRVELKADAVTEEMLAKVVFDVLPQPLPPIGELAEVTVDLAALPATPTIPNAAIRRVGGRVGVWQIVNNDLRFTPVTLGAYDLAGFVQVREGLNGGDQVVIYSEKALTSHSRIDVVENIPGVQQ